MHTRLVSLSLSLTHTLTLSLSPYQAHDTPSPPHLHHYAFETGSSPNTWPQIYRNLQNIDYCTNTYKSISLRLNCIKAFEPANFLP